MGLEPVLFMPEEYTARCLHFLTYLMTAMASIPDKLRMTRARLSQRGGICLPSLDGPVYTNSNLP